MIEDTVMRNTLANLGKDLGIHVGDAAARELMPNCAGPGIAGSPSFPSCSFAACRRDLLSVQIGQFRVVRKASDVVRKWGLCLVTKFLLSAFAADNRGLRMQLWW